MLKASSQNDHFALYNSNLEIYKKVFLCCETQDFETFKSFIHKDVQYQFPMYGEGKVDDVNAIGLAELYRPILKYFFRKCCLVTWC